MMEDLFEDFKVQKDKEDKYVLKHPLTNEPLFIEHRKGGKVLKYEWHPVQTQLHAELASSSEWNLTRHERSLKGRKTAINNERSYINALYEAASDNDFKDKIPHSVESKILKKSSADGQDVEYQKVHLHDPHTNEIIMTAHKKPGAVPIHNPMAFPPVVNQDFLAAHKIDPTVAQDMINNLDSYDEGAEYDAALDLHRVKGNSPFGVGLHSGSGHSVYTTRKNPEEVSQMHEQLLKQKTNPNFVANVKIVRTSPTSFEYHCSPLNAGVTHSFAVPGQLHVINTGPMYEFDDVLDHPE